MRKCLTPGAMYHISVTDKNIGCSVDVPMSLNLSESQAKIIENKIHDALEKILSPYFLNAEGKEIAKKIVKKEGNKYYEENQFAILTDFILQKQPLPKNNLEEWSDIILERK